MKLECDKNNPFFEKFLTGFDILTTNTSLDPAPSVNNAVEQGRPAWSIASTIREFQKLSSHIRICNLTLLPFSHVLMAICHCPEIAPWRITARNGIMMVIADATLVMLHTSLFVVASNHGESGMLKHPQ